jgi:putative ABC transport system ATP-binding protein
VKTLVSLSVKALTVEFADAGYTVRLLNGFSFDCDDGQLVVLLGPSGCGKTTLLSCLAGLLKPTSGSIWFNDVEVTGLRGPALSAYRRQTVGAVFETFNLNPRLNALSNVSVRLRRPGVSHSTARERAMALLTQVGLDGRAEYRPGQLSYGQQQRVAIARALVYDPPLILVDEPTAHLDFIQVAGILRLLRALASPGRTVVVATHDQRISQLADKVVELIPSLPIAEPAPREVMLEAGEYVFRQGDSSDLVYLIRSGEIEILRDMADGSQYRLSLIGAGAYFGEFGPMLNLPRGASARALTTAVLTGCSVQQFREQVTQLRSPYSSQARYDTDRAVAAFAARLQDAVDLDAICADLLGVVNAELEPAHLSLWIPAAG